MKRIVLTAILALVPFAVAPAVRAGEQPKSAGITAKSIVIVHDTDTLSTQITLEARKGRVAWADILVGLSRAKGFDDSAFADLMPSVPFRLDLSYSPLVVSMWNRALPRGVQLQMERGAFGQEPRLTITLDRAV